MRRPVRTALHLLALAALAGASGAIGACSTAGGSQHAAVASNPTPELLTLYRRPVDFDNMTVITFNSNRREMWDDFARGALWDRPSRLARESVTH